MTRSNEKCTTCGGLAEVKRWRPGAINLPEICPECDRVFSRVGSGRMSFTSPEQREFAEQLAGVR